MKKGIGGWKAIALATFLSATLPAVRAAQEGQPTGNVRYTEPVKIAELENRAITESSGLAPSRRREGVFWTHNDSGDRPRLFAFDTAGRHLSTLLLRGARAVDWEDMASVRRNRTNYLLCGDIGDNERKRETCTIYVVEEPALPDQPGDHKKTLRPTRSIVYRYEDGPRDCESLAVDPTEERILLVSKVMGLRCTIYSLPLLPEEQKEPVQAEAIARLTLPPATGMDISPDGHRAVIVTYEAAYEYVRAVKEDWETAFGRAPQRIPAPPRAQGESICYGPDGRTLYLTSERLPTPLWEIEPTETP